MPGIVVAVVLILVVIIFCAIYFEKDRRIKRAIRAVPLAPLAQPRTGMVRVAGQLQYVQQPLQSPLTGRVCAYYDVRVEEWRRHGRSGSWRTIIEEKFGHPFVIVDQSGKAFIQLDGTAEIACKKDVTQSSGTFNDARPHLEAFLARHGTTSTGLLGFNKKLRYLEGVLEAGELITVVGVASQEVDPNPGAGFAGYREAPTWMVVRRSQDKALLVTDDPSVARP